MSATETFPGAGAGLATPAENAWPVTPSDSTDLTAVTRGLRVGTTAGTIRVTMKGGQTLDFTGVQVGEILPVRATRVWSTGTTAVGIVALW